MTVNPPPRSEGVQPSPAGGVPFAPQRALHPNYPLSLGAIVYHRAGVKAAYPTSLRIWAPKVQKVELHLLGSEDRVVPMEAIDRGYFQAVVEDAGPGALYRFRLDGRDEFPDPASRFQPQGVHGPSQVVDPHFDWTDAAWSGLPLADYITYELHVGTFTPEGTFDAIIGHLDELKDLGITAIELMPLAQFPGERNWGYDGAYPFAVQNSYGGPEGLKRLVDACHARGMAVLLDVVYNHLGPEGNYLGQFGHYFTDRHRTPWGLAINFDGPASDEVRRYFIENALYWVSEFHIDGLRLDAVHAIYDQSARPFLQELAAAVHEQAELLNRRVVVIAESNLNDARLVRPVEAGGYGLDAQWTDDFHHALHAVLTGEHSGYYEDFAGFEHLVKAFRDGFVFSGEYSNYRGRRHGNSSRGLPAASFVICAQNHDQVGNRMLGERLSELVSFEKLKLAAAATLLSPYSPLLFMGEEYGETAPFQYFVSHADPDLVEAVRRGRKEEFATFRWHAEPPDPQDEATFQRAKLNHDLKRWAGFQPARDDAGRGGSAHHETAHSYTAPVGETHPTSTTPTDVPGGPAGIPTSHVILREFYKTLIHLRKTLPPLFYLRRDQMEVIAQEKLHLLAVRRWTETWGKHSCLPESLPAQSVEPGRQEYLPHVPSDIREAVAVFHFGDHESTATLALPPGRWTKVLDSAEERWHGPGSPLPSHLESAGEVALRVAPHSVALLVKSAGEISTA